MNQGYEGIEWEIKNPFLQAELMENTPFAWAPPEITFISGNSSLKAMV
jgi:hypothetical protein